MQTIFDREVRVIMSGLIVVSLLILFCTNVSEATIGTGTQVVPVLPVSSSSAAERIQGSGANFVLELIPGGYLYSPDADGFWVGPSGGYWREEIEGNGSWMPSARAGVRINAPMVGIDITGGGGFLWNNAVSGPFAMLDCAANFYIGRNVSLGPHIGLVSFGDLESSDVEEVDFSGNTGLMAGLVLNTGGKTASFYLSFDYIEAEFDVETEPGWTASDDTFDMSGYGIQAGLILRF